MSYILDALRKADAQRERDASRGIHANPAQLGPAGAGGSHGSRAGVWTAVIVGVAVAIGAGAYFMRDSTSPAPVAGNVPAPSLPPATPVKMTPPQEVANAIVPPAPPPVAAPAPSIGMPPQAMPVPGMSADERARQAKEAAFASRGAMPGVPRPIPAPPQPAQANPQPQAAPTAAGLPADAPKVAISGGVYSPSPAQRMLIVNGQVYNEGSEIAPGLTIDRIEARTAVLKFRGALYTVAY